MFAALASLAVLAAAAPLCAQEWHPASPEKDAKDWVLLKSGEWLRGNMDLFRDMKMEFDSDELDDVVLDWEDISGFRLPRDMTFVFTGGRVFTGPSSMRDGMIRINAAGGTVDLPRSQLLSIIEGNSSEWNFWSAKASLGYSQRAGNTDQVDLSTRVSLKREATRSRTTAEYREEYSKVSGEEKTNNQKGDLSTALFISRRFFITPLAYEYYSDKFQNIEYRNTIGAGVGYFIFRKSTVDWAIGIAGAYENTRFLSVEAGEDTYQESGAVIPSLDLDWDITGDIEWELSYSSKLGVPRIRTSTHHASTDLSVDIYRDIFEINFSVVWDRVDNPKAFEDGTVPRKDDIKIVFGFGIDL